MHPLLHPLFIQFVVYFNEHKDYFEGHEVLEEYWKEIAPGDKTHPLTAWILLSTGMYHWRRGNITGASRTLQRSLQRFDLDKGSAFYKGVDLQDIISHIEHSIEAINEKRPFRDFPIPITSPQLEAAIGDLPKQIPLEGSSLINKHMLRDRSEILKAREEKRRNRY